MIYRLLFLLSPPHFLSGCFGGTDKLENKINGLFCPSPDIYIFIYCVFAYEGIKRVREENKIEASDKT